MKNIKFRFSRFKREFLSLLCLSSTLFIFEACYGTPQDFGADVYIEGIVKSATTNNPVQGIKVTIDNLQQYVYSSEDGTFSFYAEPDSQYVVSFEDVDNDKNKSFKLKDTVLKEIDDYAYIEVLLEEK